MDTTNSKTNRQNTYTDSYLRRPREWDVVDANSWPRRAWFDCMRSCVSVLAFVCFAVNAGAGARADEQSFERFVEHYSNVVILESDFRMPSGLTNAEFLRAGRSQVFNRHCVLGRDLDESVAYVAQSVAALSAVSSVGPVSPPLSEKGAAQIIAAIDCDSPPQSDTEAVARLEEVLEYYSYRLDLRRQFLDMIN